MALLSPEMDALLQEVAGKHGLDTTEQRQSQGRWLLSSQDRDQLIDAVTLEFTATGLDADDEPNRRGLELEGLVDHLNILE